MQLIYKHVESGACPKTIEIGLTTVYLRKDIVKETLTDPTTNESYVKYTYQEAKLSHDEFNDYSNELLKINTVKGVNDSENIDRLVVNGVDSTENQLILMEAIADLYDVIASMM